VAALGGRGSIGTMRSGTKGPAPYSKYSGPQHNKSVDRVGHLGSMGTRMLGNGRSGGGQSGGNVPSQSTKNGLTKEDHGAVTSPVVFLFFFFKPEAWGSPWPPLT